MSEYLAQQAAAAAHQQAATPRPINVLAGVLKRTAASTPSPSNKPALVSEHLAKQANQPAGQPQPLHVLNDVLKRTTVSTLPSALFAQECDDE